MSQQDFDRGFDQARTDAQNRQVWAQHGQNIGNSLGGIGGALGSLFRTIGEALTKPRPRDTARPRPAPRSLGKQAFLTAILGAIGFYIWAANSSAMEPGPAAVLGAVLGALIPPVLAAAVAVLEVLARVAYFLFKVALVVGVIALIIYAIANWHQ